MFSLLTGRGDRLPQPRLDRAPLNIYFQLDLNDFLIFAALAFVAPLFVLATDLPMIWKIVAAASFPGWGALLFFVSRDRETALIWLTRMLPYWLRRRRFSAARAATVSLDAATDLLDEAVAVTPNLLSYRYETGADGVTELHIFECPIVPYAGWIELGGRPAAERWKGRLVR